MKISAIVPVYNGAGRLASCLESILTSARAAESAAAELELVVVDDASTDGTGAVVEDFRRRVPGMVAVRHAENLGSGEARNTGLANASGSWIAWVDADDLVAPAWFGSIVSAIGKEDADAIAFAANMHRRGETRTIRYCSVACLVDAAEFCRDALRDLGVSTWMWNKVFRHELFDGLAFSGRCQEDFRILPRVMARARRVRNIPDALYEYNRPEGSLSRHGDASGSRDGLIECLGVDWRNEGFDGAMQSAWLEGIALRAADYLRNCAPDAELRSFLRKNAFRVLLDARQPFRQKAKCLIACLRAGGAQ